MTAATAPDASTHAGSKDDAIGRLLDFDFARPVAFAMLALVFVASRIAFVNVGYGADEDAWRVALTGHWLWDHHEYYPSRLPGNPLPEFASALVIKGGWLATNALTVAVSLAGVWCFARITSRLELPHRGAIVVAFAFMPLLWINSAATMDYMWALTFILAAYLFTLDRRGTAAGLMLGLAIASRPASGVVLVPLLAFMWLEGRRRDAPQFVAAALIVPAIFYAPGFWRYGAGLFEVFDPDVGFAYVLRVVVKNTFGIFGFIALAVAAAASYRSLPRLADDVRHDRHVMVAVLVIALTFAVFLRLPHEAAYLIPAIPFALFLMARYFGRAPLVAAIAVMLVAGWVDLSEHDGRVNLDVFTEPRLGRGLILENRDTMIDQRRYVERLEDEEVSPHTVIALGYVYPEFVVRNRDRLEIGVLRRDEDAISQLSDLGQAIDGQRDIIYVWLLPPEDFQRFKDAGYKLRHTVDAEFSTQGVYHYDPTKFGSKLLDVPGGPGE